MAPPDSAARLPVLVIDDHLLVAQGLALLIERDLGLPTHIVGSCAEALAQLGVKSFALAVLDLEMPGVGGLQALPRLRDKAPRMPVVVVSANPAPMAVDAVLKNGASAFVGKGEPPERLIAVLRRALRMADTAPGGTASAHSAADSPESAAAKSGLTARQAEVLLLMSQGKSNKLIARHLDSSENTVRNHVAAILERLQADNRFEAVATAQRLGLLAPA